MKIAATLATWTVVAALMCPTEILAHPADRRTAEILFLRLLAQLEDCQRDGECGAFEASLAELEELARARCRDGRLRYWLGMTYLRLGRTEDALAEIEAGLRGRSYGQIDRGRMRSALGLARLEAGDARGALEVLEKAERDSPEHGIVLCRLAEALDALGETEEALAKRDQARDAHHDPCKREAGLSAPSVWNGRVAPSPARLVGRVDLLAGSDSNPSLQDEDVVLESTSGDNLEGGNADAVAHLAARLEYRPLLEQGPWSLGFGIEGQSVTYGDQAEFDFTSVRAVAQAGWGEDPSGLLTGRLGSIPVRLGQRRLAGLLQVGLSQGWLGGSRYVQVVEGDFRLVIRQGPSAASHLDLIFEDRDFESGDLRRSGETVLLELAQELPLGRQHGLRIGLQAGERFGDRAYRSSIAQGNVTLSLRIASAWAIQLQAAYREDDYEHPESNLFRADGPARDDATRLYNGSLIWRLDHRLRLVANLRHQDRESNVQARGGGDLGYRRTTAVLGAVWTF